MVNNKCFFEKFLDKLISQYFVPFTLLLWLTNPHSCFRDKIKLKSGISKKQGDMALLLAHYQGRVYDEADVVNISLWLGVT